MSCFVSVLQEAEVKDGEEQGAASGQDPSQPADVHTQARSAQGLGKTIYISSSAGIALG